MDFSIVVLLFLASSLLGLFIVLAPFRKKGKEKRSKASTQYTQGHTASMGHHPDSER